MEEHAKWSYARVTWIQTHTYTKLLHIELCISNDIQQIMPDHQALPHPLLCCELFTVLKKDAFQMESLFVIAHFGH